ncbi:MAG: hypothetical protein COA78_20700 [Blastopirellula sp.]|nr:MAG: hypothetical protein COA78_20700 [Blastopirellula sp.]
MEEALQRYNTQPSASEHMEAFDAHQSQLLMLGYFQQELFFAPARLGTPEYRDLIQAVMKHAENRPICSWTPQPNGVSISVYATAKDMTKWRTLLGEHNGTTLSP